MLGRRISMISGYYVRKMFKKDKDYIDLDSRLEGVKGKFSDCCRKIGKFFGV